MRSTSASGSSAVAAVATFYDGETARRRIVSVEVAGQDLVIVEDGETVASWPLGDVRRRDSPDSALWLSRDDGSLARVEIDDPDAKTVIAARCPNLDRDRPTERTLPIVAWCLAAAASLILSALYLVPILADRLTVLIPVSVEKRLGTAVDNQVRTIFRGRTCGSNAGTAALGALAMRLARAAGSDTPPDITVLGSRIENAITLPGGRIYLFDGLLQKAASVDEIAGVLGHEMGHAAHRDGLRSLLHTGGTSFLLGLLFGDVTGGTAVVLGTRLMIDSAYSRAAERAADLYAADAMVALGRSPGAMGRLLKRIDKGALGLPALLQSHPLTDERLATLMRQEPAVSKEPLLTDDEWRALKAICKE